MLQPSSEQEKMVSYVQPRVCPELELGVSTELDKSAILIAIRYGAESVGVWVLDEKHS